MIWSIRSIRETESISQECIALNRFKYVCLLNHTHWIVGTALTDDATTTITATIRM